MPALHTSRAQQGQATAQATPTALLQATTMQPNPAPQLESTALVRRTLVPRRAAAVLGGEEDFEGGGNAQQLQLGPHLALLAAHAVHDAGDVVEGGLGAWGGGSKWEQKLFKGVENGLFVNLP